MTTGTTILVSLRHAEGHVRSASVWRRRPASGRGAVRFDDGALKCFDDAVVLAAKALPVRWRQVGAIRTAGPAADLVRTVPSPGAAPDPERIIDGDSFGLAFVLGVASELLEIPVPEDLCALGAIDRKRGVIPVDGFGAKCRAVEKCCPEVTRLLVARTQEIPDDVAGFFDWVPVSTVAEAIQTAFPDPEQSLIERLADSDFRSEAVKSLFRLVAGHPNDFHDWKPVERAAELALCAGVLSPLEVARLQFVQVAAARHAANEGGPWFPDEEWLKDLPAEQRIRVVAHAVQHAADFGPDDAAARRAEQEARSRLPGESDQHACHLMLRGALGRLLAVTGRPEEALEHQRAAALAFLRRPDATAASYPLTEWYRLARVLGNDLEEVRRVHERARRDEPDGVFLRLASALADVAAGCDRRAELMRIVGEFGAPAHVQVQAIRWIVRLSDQAGDRAEGDRVAA